MASAAASQEGLFRRPPKKSRRRAFQPATEEVRVIVTKTPEMISRGFHPEQSLLKDDWVIDEATRVNDGMGGSRFEMVIGPEKYNELRARNDAKTKALEGMSRKARETGAVTADVEIEVVKETISGGTMRRELAAVDAANTSGGDAG